MGVRKNNLPKPLGKSKRALRAIPGLSTLLKAFVRVPFVYILRTPNVSRADRVSTIGAKIIEPYFVSINHL